MEKKLVSNSVEVVFLCSLRFFCTFLTLTICGLTVMYEKRVRALLLFFSTQQGTGPRLRHLISTQDRRGFRISNMTLAQENSLLNWCINAVPFH